MFNVVVVVLFLIALGLLWRTREHLAPTANILEPGGEVQYNYKRYTPEQQQANWNRLPESSKNYILAPYITAGYNKDEMSRYPAEDASLIISKFYGDVYAPASSPITLSDIDKWMKDNKVDSIKEYRNMLEAYFVQGGQTSASATPPTPQPALEPTTTESAPQPVPNSDVFPPEAPGPQSASEPKTIDIKTPTTITINVRP